MGTSRERGSAALEFAMVLPILLILTLAVVQVGLIVRDELVLVGAAREGAREAAVTSDDDAVRAAIARAATPLDADRIDADISRSKRGEPATVGLTYEAPVAMPFVGWLFPSSITLRATAAMRQEFG